MWESMPSMKKRGSPFSSLSFPSHSDRGRMPEPDAILEFIAKDQAWYAGTASLQGAFLRVHFQDFSVEEDELWPSHRFKSAEEAKQMIRPASQAMQDYQCKDVHPGMILCVACRRPPSKCFEYYDAEVLEVKRSPHKVGANREEYCECIFKVKWRGGHKQKQCQEVRCGDICFLVPGDVEDDPVIREFLQKVDSATARKRKASTEEKQKEPKSQKTDHIHAHSSIGTLKDGSKQSNSLKQVGNGTNSALEDNKQFASLEQDGNGTSSALEGIKQFDSAMARKRKASSEEKQKGPKSHKTDHTDGHGSVGTLKDGSKQFNSLKQNGNGTSSALEDNKQFATLKKDGNATSDALEDEKKLLGSKLEQSSNKSVCMIIESDEEEDIKPVVQILSGRVHSHEPQVPKVLSHEVNPVKLTSSACDGHTGFPSLSRKESCTKLSTDLYLGTGHSKQHTSQAAAGTILTSLDAVHADFKKIECRYTNQLPGNEPDCNYIRSGKQESRSKSSSVYLDTCKFKQSIGETPTTRVLTPSNVTDSDFGSIADSDRPIQTTPPHTSSSSSGAVEDSCCNCRSNDCGLKKCQREELSCCTCYSVAAICPHAVSCQCHFSCILTCRRSNCCHCSTSSQSHCCNKSCSAHCCDEPCMSKGGPHINVFSEKHTMEEREFFGKPKKVTIYSPSQLLLVENLEKDITPFKAQKIVSKVSHGALMVNVWPSLEYERTRKGYIYYQDSHAAESAYRTFSERKFMIVSSRGRPWVIRRPNLGLSDWNQLRDVDVSAAVKEEEDDMVFNLSDTKDGDLLILYSGTAEYTLALGKQKLFLEQRKVLESCYLQFSKEEEELERLCV